jgi:2-amino-4-hydroxy-6-hydroxymethyldihydropteridine diphosphokinase
VTKRRRSAPVPGRSKVRCRKTAGIQEAVLKGNVSAPEDGRAPAAKVIVALGSNLGDSVTILRRAFLCLAALSARRFRRSSLWRSTPVDCPPGSPPFINAAVAFEPAIAETPESLLAKLQAIEKVFGRRPKAVLNEPRPLDLDLIAFGSEVRATPQLILPHPRAHLRRFVLAPLNEIAPGLVLPGQKNSVRQLLAELQTDEVLRRMSESEP